MPDTDMESYRRPVLFTVGITALVVVLVFLLWRVADIFVLAFAGLLVAVLLLSVTSFLSHHTPLKGTWSLLVTLLLLLALPVEMRVGRWFGRAQQASWTGIVNLYRFNLLMSQIPRIADAQLRCVDTGEC